MAQIYLGTSYSEIFQRDLNKPQIVRKWGNIGEKAKVKAIEICPSYAPTTFDDIFNGHAIKQQENNQESEDQMIRKLYQHQGKIVDISKLKKEQKNSETKFEPEFVYASTIGLYSVYNQNNIDQIASYQCQPAGLHLLDSSFVSVLRNGKVLLTYCKKGEYQHISATIYQHKNASKINLGKGQGFYKTTAFGDKNKICMVGKNVLPIVYNIASQVVTWEGKNVPNDYLDLQVPIHDNDVSIFQETLIATLHQFKRVRLYDIKNNKKRPILDAQVKTPYNQQTVLMQKSCCKNYLYVATNQGNIYQCDRRKGFAISGKFKNTPNASISSMVLQGSHLIACGLDGNLRVFNCESKDMQRKTFVNRAVFSIKIKSQTFELSDIEHIEQHQAQKADKEIKKVKQIRKRNKVGLAYLRVKNQQQRSQKQKQQQL